MTCLQDLMTGLKDLMTGFISHVIGLERVTCLKGYVFVGSCDLFVDHVTSL